MPRAAVKARYVREFLLRELKSIYERKRDKYIKLATTKKGDKDAFNIVFDGTHECGSHTLIDH